MKQTIKKQKVTAEDTNALPGIPVSDPIQTASGLQELFTDGIKDMYWAENHLVKNLPKMVSAAGKAELKTALANHLEQTVKHSDRLEKVLNLLGTKIQAKKCDSMEGLVMSGEHIIENTLAGSEARDTGIIMAALKVENFEITSYNGLIQLAATLGQSDVADILRQNLADEMEANKMLTVMSEKNAPSEVKVLAN